MDTEHNIADFWLSPEVEKYAKFAREVIPANMLGITPGHALIYQHLIQHNLVPRALDFGCFYGDSSIRLFSALQNHKREMQNHRIDPSKISVLGVDCVESFISEAKVSRIVPGANLNYIYVPDLAPIPLSEPFSAAVMYFVDQVIPDDNTLLVNFKKVYDSLSQNGILVILRLTEDSFDPALNFAFYAHNKHIDKIYFNSESNERKAIPFTNELLLPERESDSDRLIRDANGKVKLTSLKFTDYFRKRAYIKDMLRTAGFNNINNYNLDKNFKGVGLASDTYHLTYSNILSYYPEFSNFSDYHHPLHELIVCIK